MSATENEITLIRIAIGDSAGTTYETDELQAFWDDAVDQHTIADRRLVRYQVIVDALEGIMVDSAKQVTYRQNSATENLSDIFKNLEKLHAKYSVKLATALAGTMSAARIGTLTKVPSRLKEWPDS